VLYQIVRSYLLDFYRGTDAEKRRVSLGLAMETLNAVLKLNPDHIPALRAKAVIHARAIWYSTSASSGRNFRCPSSSRRASTVLLSRSSSIAFLSGPALSGSGSCVRTKHTITTTTNFGDTTDFGDSLLNPQILKRATARPLSHVHASNRCFG
jgi:hypothetical protein